jgi:hypothetical protein
MACPRLPDRAYCGEVRRGRHRADGVTNRFRDQGSTLWIGCDQWVAEDCTLDVYLDPDGRASWVKVDPRPAEPSMVRRLCARVGL